MLVQSCELLLQPPVGLTRRIRAWSGRAEHGPAFAQYDRFFRVERSTGQGVHAAAHMSAVAAAARLLACSPDIEAGHARGLEQALCVAAELLGISAEAEPAPRSFISTAAGTLTCHLRWRLGHHLFFVLVQALVIAHDRIVGAASAAEVATELVHGTALFDGAQAAMHLTAHMTPADYDTVRETMKPPNVGPRFSGLDSPDHAALIAIARLAGPIVMGLKAHPSLRAAIDEYRGALNRLYDAHARVCEHCVPSGPSLLGEANSGNRGPQEVLGGLRDRFHRYAQTSTVSSATAPRHGATMRRIPEPELMDQPAQAAAYAEADFDAPDARFLEIFLARFGNVFTGRIADLGCGPGNIALRLARDLPRCEVTGVDGAASMLEHARLRARRFGEPGSRVRWVQAVLPSSALPHGAFEAVVSNSLLHHLHDPTVLWRTILKIAAPGAAVLVGDLRRPRTESDARDLVETYAADESPVLKEDFFASLCAAFQPDEVRAQLREEGLPLTAEEVGDRHLLVWGHTDSAR